jgi:hypothetical protein
MADKHKAVGGGSLTHTLHVWPADELIAQSAYWPSWWYPAYERAARQLADRVACCILGGLPDCPGPIRTELQPSGSLTFSVQLWGTTIEVLIWDFEGPDDPEPDAPGPDGGARQRAADGLVLGLRGTGKEFSVAPFYDGLVPPVPVGRGGRLRPWTVRVTTAASPLGTLSFSSLPSGKASAIILQGDAKVDMRCSQWPTAAHGLASRSTRFDDIGFEQSIFERPQPLEGMPIPEPCSCLETPCFGEA